MKSLSSVFVRCHHAPLLRSKQPTREIEKHNASKLEGIDEPRGLIRWPLYFKNSSEHKQPQRAGLPSSR